jgi:hypothetical protein
MRIPRHIAAELIQFVKKVEVKAHYWDPKSTSAFEFARQMSSAKLKKINPSLDVKLDQLEKPGPSELHVEYLDGSKWTTSTYGLSANELRGEFYMRATDAEDKMGGGDKGDAGDAGGKKGGAAGGKGGGGGAKGGAAKPAAGGKK